MTTRLPRLLLRLAWLDVLVALHKARERYWTWRRQRAWLRCERLREQLAQTARNQPPAHAGRKDG